MRLLSKQSYILHTGTKVDVRAYTMKIQEILRHSLNGDYFKIYFYHTVDMLCTLSDAYEVEVDLSDTIKTLDFFTIDMYFEYLAKKQELILEKSRFFPPHIVSALAYIHRYFHKYSMGLEEIAVFAGVHAAYLSTEFSLYLNTSINKYINFKRVEKAKKLLLEPDITINDIAVQVGYSDARYFRKQFKNFVGIPPTEYRTCAQELCE